MSLYRSALIGALALPSLLALNQIANAGDSRRVAQEKGEVRAIFQVVLPQHLPKEEAPRDNERHFACVLSESWPEPDKGNGKPAAPQPLLTPREAMDPSGRYADRFCNTLAQDATVKALLDTPETMERDKFSVSSLSLTYPIFNASLTRATIKRDRWSLSGYKDGRRYVGGAGGTIYLRKRHGVWTARYDETWGAN